MNRNLIIKCLDCGTPMLKRCQSKNLVHFKAECEYAFEQRVIDTHVNWLKWRSPWHHDEEKKRLCKIMNKEIVRKCNKKVCICSKLGTF